MIHEILKKQFLIAICAILGYKATTIQGSPSTLKTALKSLFILQFDTPTTRAVNPEDMTIGNHKLATLLKYAPRYAPYVKYLLHAEIIKPELRTMPGEQIKPAKKLI